MENKAKRYQKALNIVDVMEHSSFAKMMKEGLATHELNQKFNRSFPPEFKGLFRVGRVSGNVLFIEVANAVVRQGILFHQTALLKLIREDYPQVEKLDVKINPEFVKITL
ncbi:DciA family protein [Rodentibacter haemolyticus]|uniref:DUF721 domain-containing protein n=1 Tax=Rodentibacter haemolyticus TaxID=2778911 RepID=A0ABX6V0U7_9PAST|nr:DciA family protein [Rodentibacter haemolyticus]QPB41946.1 DUF721 domain-containing protein [Rodentibacter haemolyticus]